MLSFTRSSINRRRSGAMHLEGQIAKQIGMEQLIEWLYRNGYVVAKKVPTPMHAAPFSFEPVEETTIKRIIPGLVEKFE
jgi:hypothetical protein